MFIRIIYILADFIYYPLCVYRCVCLIFLIKHGMLLPSMPTYSPGFVAVQESLIRFFKTTYGFSYFLGSFFKSYSSTSRILLK
ncbi:hypothetical protein BY458DRAFT_498249 [Sporodiniella umbellata]|nr:hypothetical protein BY458DRAFT_498249 [Sporodiniella umbellata]